MTLDRRVKAVFCDFDGTVTREDGTDAVLERFADASWRDWELRWTRGEITSRDCLSHQVALIRATKEEIESFAATLPIDEGIFDLARGCRDAGVPLTIVSDGLDVVIQAVLRHHALSLPVFSSRVEATPTGTLQLVFPYSSIDCSSIAGTCKCSFVNRVQGRTVYVGDGRSDFCVSRQATSVFAKSSLRAWCEREGIAHHSFESLRDVASRIFQEVHPV